MATNSNRVSVPQMAAESGLTDASQVMANAFLACDDSLNRLLNEASGNPLMYISGAVLAAYRLRAWLEVARKLSEPRKTKLLQASAQLKPHLQCLHATYWRNLEADVSNGDAGETQDLHGHVSGLHDHVSGLHALMAGGEQERLQDTICKAYCTIILTCDVPKKLMAMLAAVETFIPAESASPNPNDELFRNLLQIKAIYRAKDEYLGRENVLEEIPVCIGNFMDDLGIPRPNVELWRPELNPKFDDTTTGYGGVSKVIISPLQDGVSEDDQMWVLQLNLQKFKENSEKHKEEILQFWALAMALYHARAAPLLAPSFIGFARDSERRHGWCGSYALMFKKPTSNGDQVSLQSLHNLLRDSLSENGPDAPTANQRLRLALELVQSLRARHTADWRLSGLRSDNVLFACHGKSLNLGEPIVAGFDFMRSSQTDGFKVANYWSEREIYKWPLAQNDPPRSHTFRKVYDIYSLGLILLEIAHWKPLINLLGLENIRSLDKVTPQIRKWLLGDEDPPFESNPLHDLNGTIWGEFEKVARRCIVGYGPDGLGVLEEADEAKVAVKMELYKAFDELVVEPLQKLVRLSLE